MRTRKRIARCALGCALLALCALLLVPAAHAQGSDDAESATIRYRVVIEAPRALADVLHDSLDIVRWQDYEDTTAVVLAQLVKEAKAQATEALAAEGYFDPTVEVTLEPEQPGEKRRVVRVRAVPGEAVHVTNVHVDVVGPAAADEAYGTQAIARVRREWSLSEGERFRQVEWDRAKARAVATLAATPYAAARIVESEARIDPGPRTADLDVRIDGGPLFRFGPITIEGLSAYDDDLVRNFSTFAPHEPHTAERLDQYVRRLQGSGYFASVQARIDTDPAQAEAAPVRVQVIEAPRHRVEGGIAYATDNRIRADLRYTDFNVNGRATQFEVTGRLDYTTQNIGVRFTRPPDASHYINSLRAQLERTDISNLQTRTALVGVRRQNVEERDRVGYDVTYYEDDQRPQGFPAERSRALYASYLRTWRNVDVLLAPTRGYVLDAEVGAAPLATRIFGRIIGRGQLWIPLGPDNELQLRLEAGAVLASSRSGVPSTLLFRTGGDTTVRGYAYESLGVQRGEATVGGRYYGVGSIEATHWFNERFGAAVFVDAGNAADELSSFRPVLGYGVGARVRSPVGPFRLDVAYGQDSHSVRLHMSLGMTF